MIESARTHIKNMLRDTLYIVALTINPTYGPFIAVTTAIIAVTTAMEPSIAVTTAISKGGIEGHLKGHYGGEPRTVKTHTKRPKGQIGVILYPIWK